MKPTTPQSGTAAEDGRTIYGRATAVSLHRLNRFSTCCVLCVVVASSVLTESTSFAFQRVAALANSRPMIQDDDAASGLSPIELLDSPNFIQRQSATERIIAEGASILPDLSDRFFDSSPETNYRIRKALEGIAAGGDEETFLKSTAILLTLYSNGNDQIFEQIEALKIDWQMQRTEMAIAALKQAGAEVVQQKGYNSQGNRLPVMIRARGANQTIGSQQIKSVKRTVAQQKKMVQSILASDAKSNRDLIFDIMPEKTRVNQALAIGITNQHLPHLAGTTIKFPKNWTSNTRVEDAFAELRQIDDRLFVELADADLSKGQWKSLAESENVTTLSLSASEKKDVLPTVLPASLQSLTLVGYDIESNLANLLERCPNLQQLQLNNCQFDERVAEKIDGVSSIKSVVCQFDNFKIDKNLIFAMAEFADMRATYFTNVDFEDGALANLRRLSNVSILHVSEMPATSQFFEAVAGMARLNSIQFKGCKLDIPAYKRLAKFQRIRMNFEAQAFLGIQGSGVVNAGQLGSDTMVSLVIPDSAADVGGIKAGDFINKIDGDQVLDFNDVRLHITQYAAGDEVAIEVLRDGKPKSLTVTLRDYKTARKF